MKISRMYFLHDSKRVYFIHNKRNHILGFKIGRKLIFLSKKKKPTFKANISVLEFTKKDLWNP